MRHNPQCTSCPLHENAQTVCLWGNGPKHAVIMAVGEAPGGYEDQEGLPFIGDSGELYNKLLRKAGFRREAIYTTNAVKCHPPYNRKPKQAELDACSPYIEHEIRRVRPDYIILMGAVALKQVLNLTGIEKYRGRPIIDDGITYFPVYHPAYALRAPRKEPILLSDLRNLYDLVQGKKRHKPFRYSLVSTRVQIDNTLRDLAQASAYSYDTECSGLNPMVPGAAIATLQVSSPDQAYVFPLDHPESPFKGKHKIHKRIIKSLAQMFQGKRVLTQNGKFDFKWIQKHYGIDLPYTDDTYLAAYLCNEEGNHDLDSLLSEHLGIPPYNLDFTKRSPMDYPLAELAEYGAKDAYYLHPLFNHLYRELAEDKKTHRLYREVYIPISRVYAHIELQGMHYDKQQADKVRRVYGNRLTVLKRKLKRVADINWNSPDQIAQVLYEDLGLPPVRLTPTGKKSTDDLCLKTLKHEGHEVPKLILQYRKYTKLLDFPRQWEERLCRGRIYPSFKLNGTVTGRPSCNDPNLQQTPRDTLVRSILTQEEGFDNVEADFSQMELRLAAERSEDEALRNAYDTGQDVHKLTAMRVLGKPEKEVTKELRFHAKTINFGFVYGAFPKTFRDTALASYDLLFTMDEAKEYRKRFFDLYPGLLDYHSHQKQLVHKYGFVRTFAGRKRRLPVAKGAPFITFDNFDAQVAHAERQAINAPIQGDVTDISFFALIELFDTFREEINAGLFRICLTVHDSITFGTHSSITKRCIPIIKKIMERPRMLKQFGIRLSVPIKVDIAIGPWGAGEEL